MSAKKQKRESLGFWRENIEALTVAIVMALLIKQFAFEAYKVPTESMEPTIIGRKDGGYRIIVNKYIYDIRDPDRWEVAVFQYPHNRLVNYVKRIVGVGNEWLFLRNGDIYTAPYSMSREEALRNLSIVRKPLSLQESLVDLSNCIPSDGRGVDSFRRYWKLENADRGVGKFSIDKGDELVKFRAGDGLTLVQFQRPSSQLEHLGQPIPVISNRRYDDWSHWADQAGFLAKFVGLPSPAFGKSPQPGLADETGDLRLRFEVRPDAEKGQVVVEIRDGTHDRPIRVRIPVDGSDGQASLRMGDDEEITFEASVDAEDWTEVEVSNVDDRVIVLVDGDQALQHEYDHPPVDCVNPVVSGGVAPPPGMGNSVTRGPEEMAGQITRDLPYDNGVSFGFDGAEASFREIDLARDIYYAYSTEGASDFHIPPRHFLMLGDNSPNSLDGRAWKVSEMVYRDADGKEIILEGDAEGVSADESKERPMMNPFDGDTRFVDVYGNDWDIDPDRIERIDTGSGSLAAKTKFGHFVKREYMLGRAYFTFWPLFQIGVIR